MIGGVVRELARSELVASSYQTWKHVMNMNRYTNAEFGDIHFIYYLPNGNGRVAVRLYVERYVTSRQSNHQTFTWVYHDLGRNMDLSEKRLTTLPSILKWTW
ncbi:hypothetical protein TNCV_966331 [Trichonephila clavipes]|nr:hypothetical protein TNCV_966331 [Trichonephila clavipes]